MSARFRHDGAARACSRHAAGAVPGHASMPRHGGFTLIELLATLAIGTLLLAGLASLVNQALDDLKGQQAALYQQQVAEAARNYLRENAAPLRAAAATPATIVPVTLNQLRLGRFLPEGFTDTNPYRQRTCVLVRQPDPVNYPGRFDALVVTSGGDPIGDKDLPAVAMQAGSGGGYIASTNPGEARGAAWRMATTVYRNAACPGSPAAALLGTAADAGHLVSSVFYDGAAQQAADFLYRNAVPGNLEANTLNTPLRLGVAAIVNAGGSCLDATGTATPALAVDSATRALLTCGATGTWSLPSTWKAPVDTYAALPAAPGSAPGDVRMVLALRRAFTFDGTAWVALAVDQNGNFDVPGTSSADIVKGRTSVESLGDVKAGHDVVAARRVTTPGVMVDSWLSTPAISVRDDFAPGDACHYPEIDPEGLQVIAYPIGTIVMDAMRRPLICFDDKTFRYANGQYTIN